MNLSGKTLAVTGVSSGIGAETARLLRFHGAQVIGLDRNQPHLTLDGFIEIDLGALASIAQAVCDGVLHLYSPAGAEP